jgi:hypothetical protein
MSIGVMVFKMMKLPRFPQFNFDIGYKPALEIGEKVRHG